MESTNLRAYVLGMLTCSLARFLVFSMLACFMSSRAYMSYILAVLKHLACLRLCVL